MIDEGKRRGGGDGGVMGPRSTTGVPRTEEDAQVRTDCGPLQAIHSPHTTRDGRIFQEMGG